MADAEGNEHEEVPSQPQPDITEWFNEHGGRLVLFVAIASAIAAIALGSVYSDELTQGGESLARVIRDVGFAAAVPPTAALALWRGCVAQRQAETDHRQADVALQSHLNERYQQGVELLDSNRMMVRIGAVHALQGLALESPQGHLVQVVRVLCAFARHPPAHVVESDSGFDGGLSGDESPAAREDVVTAVRTAGECVAQHRDLARDVGLILQLHGVQLANANLTGANLRGAKLTGARLVGAILAEADLTEADLADANLVEADLRWADLIEANLLRADLSAARLDDANLTRATLIEANLEGAGLARASLTNARLHNSSLSDAYIEEAHLTGALLIQSNLSRADLTHAIMTNASLIGADLTAADLGSAQLYDANFHRANLTSARFCTQGGSGASGLRQAQLDAAVAEPDDPPVLDHVVDAETGEPLVWRGGAPD